MNKVQTSRKPSKRKLSRKKSKQGGKQDVHKKIIKHLDSIEKSIREKNLLSFFVFPDKGFSKIKKSRKEMQKLIKSDVNKYKGRKLAEVGFYFNYKTEDGVAYNNLGIYATISIRIWTIDNEGNIQSKKRPGWILVIHWKHDDFKVSKITMKLIEKLVQLTANNSKIQTGGIYGLPLLGFVDKILKGKKIDISDVLTPLI